MFRLTLFAFLMLTGCGGCSPAELQIDEVDTSKIEEDRSWETWKTCGYLPGDNPCNFELKNQHGELVELYDYYDEVIVIDLSTMWCGVCAQIAPKGDEFVGDYGDANFEWLTLMIDDSEGNPPDQSDLIVWADLFGVTGHILAGDRSLIDQAAQTGFPVSGWPTLVVIDRSMVLQYGLIGWNETTIRGWVEQLLKE
jgi:thiol-disulfide isomerase/thioredoxin